MTAGPASSDVVVAAGPRRLVQAIKALVPIAFIAAIVAHALPFLYPNPGSMFPSVLTGFSTFLVGIFVLSVAPLDPYFEAFSFPLIAACVGLILLGRRGRLRSVGPLVSALVSSIALGSAYLLDSQAHWAYGYFVAEGCFLVATVAAAVRFILLRRSSPVSNALVMDSQPADSASQPAASASQELLSRYRQQR
jgi:hypothetical protein